MKRWKIPAALAAGAVLWGGVAVAQTKPADCDPVRVPQKVEGQVVKIEADKGKVTIREANGTVHEFQGSKETLQEYKVGDTLEAKLRTAPKC